MALTNKLSAIGDAIRSKTGGTELLTLDQMPEAITSITTEKTLVKTKLGEYTIQEPVQIFDITPTEQMQNCEFLYVNLVNVKPTAQDWIYPRVNGTGFGYTGKITEANGIFAVCHIPNFANTNQIRFVIPLTLSLTNYTGYKSAQTLTSFGIHAYTSGNTLASGTLEVWGYVEDENSN